MWKAYFLKFDSIEQGLDLLEQKFGISTEGDLIEASHSHSIDIVGELNGSFNVNLITTRDISEFEPFLITPEYPKRVWA